DPGQGWTSTGVTHVQDRGREEQRRQLAEVQRRGGFARQLLRGDQALGNQVRVAKFLVGHEAYGVEHIEAGLWALAGRKQGHVALLPPPRHSHSSILPVFGVENEGTGTPGE